MKRYNKIIASILVLVIFSSLILFGRSKQQQQPQQQEKKINLSLTVTEVNKVLTALSKLTYEEAAPLITNITNQGNAQLQPSAKDTTSSKKH